MDGTFYGVAVCIGCLVPFDGLPATAQVAKPIYRNLPTYSHTVARDGPNLDWRHHGETWQIYALGYLTGGDHVFDAFTMHFPRGNPPVTDRLFKPPPDGLGAYPEQFFDRYFEPVPLDHYPYVDTYTGWCADPTIGCD